MKDIRFISSSLSDIKHFPLSVKREIGYQLDRVQRDLDPIDWKSMKSIGQGVREVRIRDVNGIYRVIYIASYLNAVIVLHAFQKKTQKTAKKDLDLAKNRFKNLEGLL